MLTFTPIVALAQSPPQRAACEPLGRIVASSNNQSLPGTLICKGDSLPPSLSSKVSFFCYWSGKVLSLIGTDQRFGKCKPSSAGLTPCTPGGSSCRRTRGAQDLANRPTLITPYGSTLLSGRPTFSWISVPGATHYRLQVSSPAQGWGSEVNTTSASYPTEQPALIPGTVYQIRVMAYRGETLLSDSTKRVNILPAEAAQRLSSLVQQISNLDLSEDEKAYLDLNAAYSTRGLVDEAIHLLEARVETGSRNPGLYRALGDHFLAAGLPNRAKSQYRVAATLAQASANSIELSRAQSGLRLTALLEEEMESPKPQN